MVLMSTLNYSRYEREKLKTRRAKPTKEEVAEKAEEQASFAPFVDAETEARPLGQWQTVQPTTNDNDTAATATDLGLPTVKHEFVYVPAANVVPEPPVKKFKEKVVTSLADIDDGGFGRGSTATGGGEFRKRKVVAAKRNVRQRLDDD